MLFIAMHKVNEAMESGAKPSEQLIADMGKLMGELISEGKMYNGAGLLRSEKRVRLRNAGGEITVTRGPLQGDNELVAGMTMLQVKSMDEAVAWSKRMAEIIGDVEIEIGPVTERWDLGLMEKPADAPLRTLALRKGDKATEANEPLPSEKAKKMDALLSEMQSAGVLLASETIKSSAGGARLRAKGGKHTWVDGPFAESKELIAGFVILRLGSLEEAKVFTDRYARILGDVEVDVREVVEKP
jgi:hypothetical protein